MLAFRARLAGLLAIGFIALLTTVGVAGAEPGTSAPVPPGVGNGILANCPANTLCLYEHKDFIGTVLEISPGTSYPSLHVLSCPGCSSSRHRSSNGTWGDMMSSWTNNTSLAYCWHEDINYGGGPVSMHGGGAALSYVGSDSNDKASSIQPC